MTPGWRRVGCPSGLWLVNRAGVSLVLRYSKASGIEMRPRYTSKYGHIWSILPVMDRKVNLIRFGILCWITQTNRPVEACQFPLRPIYNATQRQYISCNAWEPDCLQGSYCQLATVDWKTRLQINPEFTLFLCCADEAVFKSSNNAAIVPLPPPLPPPPLAPSIPPFPSFVPAPAPSPASVPASGPLPVSAPAPSLPPTSIIPPVNLQQLAKDPSQPDPSNPMGLAQSTGNDFGLGSKASPMPLQSIVQKTNAAGPVTKNPILPPQAQIVLPGNGHRVDGPQVIQLIVGEMTQNGPTGMYKYSGSITLVQDSGLNILVDSGSAQNRNKLLAALAQQGIRPQNIQLIVYTHAHPDHIGNDNLFPYAQKMYSTTFYKGDEYMPLQYMQEPSMRLTQNVEVWQTPGHTYQHNSIIVRNVPNEGNVAISGDLFLNEDDLSNPSVWQAVSVDKDVQTQMRNMILCQVDYIIPGHGSPFRVTQQHKTTAVCASRFLAKARARPVRITSRKQ